MVDQKNTPGTFASLQLFAGTCKFLQMSMVQGHNDAERLDGLLKIVLIHVCTAGCLP
jgi:hypothetical protein